MTGDDDFPEFAAHSMRNPIEPDPQSAPFKAEVIDLGDFRVQHGRPRFLTRDCRHDKLVYNEQERRVFCEDCQRDLEGFDAFMALVNRASAIFQKARMRLEEANEALANVARLRAVKALDKAWSGRTMAVSCPHCDGGLLPEDFVTIRSATSRDLELARRRRKERK